MNRTPLSHPPSTPPSTPVGSRAKVPSPVATRPHGLCGLEGDVDGEKGGGSQQRPALVGCVGGLWGISQGVWGWGCVVVGGGGLA